MKKLKLIIAAAANWFSRKLNEIKMARAIRKAERMAAARVSGKRAEFWAAADAVNVNTWPPVDGTTTGYDETAGVTTVKWGTDGLLQSPKPASGFYVVNSFRQSVKKEEVYLPNGSGIEAGLITLVHGYQWEVTVRDDRSMTPPGRGDTILITDAAGIVDETTGGAIAGNVFTARVLDPDYTASPKQPGERVIKCEALLLVDGTSGLLVKTTAV
jgi:hypothetical protein